MMRKFLSTMMVAAGMVVAPVVAGAETVPVSAYAFEFPPLMGEQPIKLSDYTGKVILIVNTASKCGFTGQYSGLEKLYKRFKDRGLVIIGVPSNDFGKQEPGDSQQVAEFCKVNYGVTFPMTAKQSVIGDNAHPFYQWAAQGLGFGSRPKWNFHKYLVGHNGHLLDYFNSTTEPESDRIVKAIEAASKK
jgi:glutathione peroxidase